MFYTAAAVLLPRYSNPFEDWSDFTVRSPCPSAYVAKLDQLLAEKQKSETGLEA